MLFTSVGSRVLNVTRILKLSRNVDIRLSPVLRCKSDDITVTISDISKKIKPAQHPEYVPRKYLLKEPNQTTLRHLRWMLQKDILGQDIFLTGGPGSHRRNIALSYLELTGREVEFIALSRDTTEADLKQRREIKNGTANYHDQSAVRAAEHGRVLILEGVEKAERNVLPVLNNLLENREMHLEDGRFLIPATRYDKLLEEHSQEELDAWRLVRVSEDFRVIALGLPSPRYPGHPLDPPLRSRFQARHIPPPTFQEQVEEFKIKAPNADLGKISQLLSCCHALVSKEAVDLGLPDFPLDNLMSAAFIFEKCPSISVFDIFYRFYPYKLFLDKEGISAVEGILDTFGVLKGQESRFNKNEKILSIQRNKQTSLVTLNKDGDQVEINVPSGSSQIEPSHSDYVETKYHNKILADIILSHASSSWILIGPKGCGKSTVVTKLAENLGYDVEPIVLYQDMTSRDLIQQRSTKPNGDTVWKDSPLITAALTGKIAILDGIHRVHSSTLAVLYRLVHDQEIQLHDGKRLTRSDRYAEMKSELKKTDEEMKKSGIFEIHPSFKLVGLAEPPVINNTSGQWLNSELLSLFNFHEMRPLDKSEEIHLIQSKFGKSSKALLKIIELAHTLRSSNDPTLKSLSGSLSTRQLLRIAARMNKFPSDDAYDAVNRAVLARFLPAVPKQALEDCMKQLGINPMENKDIDTIKCSVDDTSVTIGKTSVDLYKTTALTKVPHILFYDVPQHLVLLERLMQDFSLGQNILLVGNQGVGKNKIVDRLLQLMNRPREYIQLHRDTTVQTLTLQSTVKDGVVVYEDSPLVQAVKLGHVLVIDEADKAPIHVTCILKTLAESGEMILSDGRRIVPINKTTKNNPNIISIHPDFRMIVLANRPGFPFLGNDFFGALGDLFSTHSMDNPTLENEVSLLKQYGPDVDDKIIHKLVKAFGELRSMADQGLVSYPYSTREVVNIVKHLQQFPDEPLTSVVKNVFDFDRYTSEVFETLVDVLHKHGIPLGTSIKNISLAKEFSLPDLQYGGTWNISKNKKTLSVHEKMIKLKSLVNLDKKTLILDRVETRSAWFTEMQAYCSIPMSENQYVATMAVTKGTKDNRNIDKVHVLTVNPMCVSTITSNSDKIDQISLKNLMNTSRSNRPKFSMFPYQSGNVLIHEEISNSLVSLNPENGNAQVVQLASFFESTGERISHALGTKVSQWKINGDLINSHNQAIFYIPNGNEIEILNLNTMTAYYVLLPCDIDTIVTFTPNKFLIQDKLKNKFILEKSNESLPYPNVLRQVETTDEQKKVCGIINQGSNKSLNNELLSKALSQNITSPNRLIASDFFYAGIIMGFPELDSSSELHYWPRKERVKTENPIITDNGQIVRILPVNKIPNDALLGDKNNTGIPNYLEVVDVVTKKVRYLPIPFSQNVSPTIEWLFPHGLPVYLSETSNEGFVTVDVSGGVRFWETSMSHIEKSLLEWRKMVGSEDNHLQVTKERYSGLDTKAPKHGKVDPKNEPHVGGNTWAGGTGGRDTAGLGGKGGPYRLDAGHTVHQLSDEEKNSVPEHVKKAAREMGIKAFKQRLKDIKMSEYDHKLYSQFSDAITSQVKTLRVILGSLQAKSNERQWLKHQTSGELDDTKLIEGLTGEKTIYRRRAEKEPEVGASQLKPKRLKLVVDVSGSMYRFNGYDGRLDRELEACVMVMEAFSGFEGKFKYDIVGHSGDEFSICFVDCNQPPTDNKQRLEVIKTMHAHSQYCLSGDHTLEATQHAISSLSKEDTDESIVIVLSDANLERYGISPTKFANLLTSSPEVNAYVIFIGSLGDQASRVMEKMPSVQEYVYFENN
ncbi:von Willebrand factor A domain-containing protein 8 isoform X2 [Aphidius gifuensis]|uniref:von Willebrand factor A domain-containing protein 8 isoform X2 n=1 Tax=Aphidius gifuensis TaxID=684658 RepID=UPI001CDBC7A9|nr:von Willebrand factor A domain-containing protein 8 isoform X2 [Aphidius gifuensis]